MKRLFGYIFLFFTFWNFTAHASSQVKFWDFRLGDHKKKSIETIKSICDYYDQPSSNRLIAKNCSTKYNPKAKLEIQLEFTDYLLSKNSLIEVSYSYLNKEGISKEVFDPFGKKFREVSNDDLFISGRKDPFISKSKNFKMTKELNLEVKEIHLELVHRSHRKNIKVKVDTELYRHLFCFTPDNTTEFFFDTVMANESGKKLTIFTKVSLQGRDGGRCTDLY